MKIRYVNNKLEIYRTDHSLNNCYNIQLSFTSKTERICRHLHTAVGIFTQRYQKNNRSNSMLLDYDEVEGVS